LIRRFFLALGRILNSLVWLALSPFLLWRLRPKREFAEMTAPSPPDYSRPEMWAVLPGASGKALFAPQGAEEASVASELARADVFYIHPTMHLRGNSWNAALDDRRVNQLVDELVVPGQASAFARSCRIFAPRYRQATLYSFVGGSDSGRRALELAYGDVRAAFEHYLQHHNQGRPFFLASHSQGSCHAIRLLEECVEADPTVHQRLVAAYVLGYTVPRDKFVANSPTSTANVAARQNGEAVFELLHPCQGPHDVGCVVSWDTFGKSGGPLHRSDKAEVWYSGTPHHTHDGVSNERTCADGQGYWQPRAFKEVLGVNPLTFSTATGWCSRLQHRGAVRLRLKARMAPGALFGGGSAPLGVESRGLSKPYPQHVDAGLAEDGYLFISEPWAPAFQQGVMPGRNFHNHDYGLFYCDIEANVGERLAAFEQQHGNS
jgi:hypothetical protein